MNMPKFPTKYVVNPLYRKHRNIVCICGSGKKVKKCCGRVRFVTIEWANDVRGVLIEYEKRKSLK